MDSTNSVIKGIERRITTRFMDFVIFSLLVHDGGEICGYDVIKYLHRKHNLLVSPGTVYSLLYVLEREELLKGRQTGEKRVYSLTPRGRQRARIIKNAETRLMKFMSGLLPPTKKN